MKNSESKANVVLVQSIVKTNYITIVLHIEDYVPIYELKINGNITLADADYKLVANKFEELVYD